MASEAKSEGRCETFENTPASNDRGLDGLPCLQHLSEDELRSAEKRLKRKLDLRLTAMIVLIYILNYLDRNNIAASKIAGIEDDLHLTPTQFSTAVSLLFECRLHSDAGRFLESTMDIPYLAHPAQVPSNIFLAQLRPSIYIPCCMAAWGIISTCTGAVQSAGGLYAARFMLGFVEAAFYPGAIFLFSSWYKRSELGVRCAFLYSGSQVGSAFSGLIAAGITNSLDGARGLRAWRWIFIIEGSITVVIALLALLILPDFPTTTKWLSGEERAVAELRLRQDAAGSDDEDMGPWSYGFKEAFKDWRTYAFAAMFHCVLVTTSTQNFFPTVVGSLGLGRVNTLLLTVPPYFFWRFRARYFAMFLMIGGGHGANAVAIAWVAKTMIRPRIKRAAAVAIVNAIGNCAQIWTTYLYAGGSPRFTLAMSVNSGFAIGGIGLAMMMRVVLILANKKLASAEEVGSYVASEKEPSGGGAKTNDRLVVQICDLI
ncbi:hypothetical protein D0864_01683 [Hortaea werneckii]|uniref:Major facilitator superfamily (MFS) profile domain-containing protein n=1 Tax=Hortaea werneckii TaxID=91943 RepID=A0A3M7H689_HORWE|nr:hypothetical protein D0864_01683 [Hortaea werneckii]